jgi:hypothetical protein
MHSVISITDKTDRRSFSDRRGKCTLFVSRYILFGGRRQNARRNTDKKRHFLVDCYSPRLLLALITLLLLNYIDSYLTLTLLQQGNVLEGNPIMDLHLENGVLPFILNKGIITSISLSVLCVFKNVHFAKIGLAGSFVAYISIVIYELYILNIV